MCSAGRVIRVVKRAQVQDRVRVPIVRVGTNGLIVYASRMERVRVPRYARHAILRINAQGVPMRRGS
jgi:hypothetical protein